MDKLKIFLAVLKKQQFWVLCGVMLVTTLVCWWLAKTGLADQYDARVRSIKSDFDAAQVQPDQPNPAKVKKVGEISKDLKGKVFDAWKLLYEEQQKKNPFPTDIFDKGFEEQFKSLKLPQGRLDSIYRERYQTFLMTDYLPKLLKIIDVRRPAEEKDIKGATGATPAGGPVPAPMGGGSPVPGGPRGRLAEMLNRNVERDLIGIVDWEQASFEKLTSHYSWTEAPSTLEVVLAQEDLWVYESLLRIIQGVNKSANATTQTNAAIKRINALEIGKDSRDAWKTALESVFKLGKTGTAGGPLPPSMSAPPAPDAANSADKQAERDLFNDRYVDATGQALVPEGDYPYVKPTPPEFKMMPVHLSLIMDQRYIPKFLVECANSSMPIEVKRIRVLKCTFEAFDLEGNVGGAARPGTPRPVPGKGLGKGMKFKPAAPAATPGGTPGGAAGLAAGIELGDFDVPVEVFGVIYIYNPPDREKLGLPPADAPAAADPTAGTPASQPASVPGKQP